MRPKTLFALVLLTVWCGSASAQAAVLMVTEERKNSNSVLWRSEGTEVRALATAAGAFRFLPDGTYMRFVTADTLALADGPRVAWDPLRGPRPLRASRSIPCDSVMAVFEAKGLSLAKPRSVGSGEKIDGYITTDSLYHPFPAGKVWSAHPNSLEMISSATGATRPGNVRVPRDSVLAVVAPPGNGSVPLGIAAAVLVVALIVTAATWESGSDWSGPWVPAR